MSGNDRSGREVVVVVDYGSQYTQLIARRVRQLGVYCEILPHDTPVAALAARELRALILSGGPASVLQPDSPGLDQGLLDLNVPVLGICYGTQLLAAALGGRVRKAEAREYGPAVLTVADPDRLLAGCPRVMDVWMSHGDEVIELPEGFRVLARTDTCPVAAMADSERRIYGVQFHPEVVHTPLGIEVFRAFLFDVAGCTGGWTMAAFAEEAVEGIARRVGEGRVLCGLSGGVDSTVVAALLSRAIGDRCVCVFVDNGLLRKGEAESVCRFFREEFPVNLRFVDASEEFLSALAGVVDPEVKRKTIGEVFIRVFRREAERMGEFRFLAQGTLYPDVIESQSAFGGPSATIKSHHNVGGLPAEMRLEIVEPLRDLFKDEVRQLALSLGLPAEIVWEQPFPGPGLAVRIPGPVTPERVALLRQADAILREEIKRAKLDRVIWQYFAVLLPGRSVAIRGDGRGYGEIVALRAVSSREGMTADWYPLPYKTLARISSRLTNELDQITRVVYDITAKPPATIEWE